jgi:hypothetical protein
VAAKAIHGYSFNREVSLLTPWLAIGGKPDQSLLDYRTPNRTTAPGAPSSGYGLIGFSSGGGPSGGGGRRVTHVINCLSAAAHPAVAAAFAHAGNNSDNEDGKATGGGGNGDDNGSARMLQLYLADEGDDERLAAALPRVVAFVHRALRRHPRSHDGSHAEFDDVTPLVYVHCQSGVNRAPSVALALLVALEKLTLQDAFALVRTARPAVRPKYLAVVSRFEETTLGKKASAPALRDGPGSTAFAQLYGGLQNDYSTSDHPPPPVGHAVATAANNAAAAAAAASPAAADAAAHEEIKKPVASFRAWPSAVPELAASFAPAAAGATAATAAALSRRLVTDCRAVDALAQATAAAAPAATSNSGTFWLPAGFSGRFSLEALAANVFEAHTRDLLHGVSGGGAEWWVQVGDNGSSSEGGGGGVGFHFDSDSALLRIAGAHRHPYLSTVTYLSAGDTATTRVDRAGPGFKHDRSSSRSRSSVPVAATAENSSNCWSGAPTMVVDWTAKQLREQRKGAPSSGTATPEVNAGVGGRRAWLAWPLAGQHVAFDGTFLHGAPSEMRRRLPCRSPPSASTLAAATDAGAGAAGFRSGAAAAAGAWSSLPRAVLVVNVWLDAPPFRVSSFPAAAMRGLSNPALASLRLAGPIAAASGASGATAAAKGIPNGHSQVFNISAGAPRLALAVRFTGPQVDGRRQARSSGQVDAAAPTEVLAGRAAAEVSALELAFAPGEQVIIF